MATKQPKSINQGESRMYTLTVKDGNGVLVNLTPTSALEFQVKANPGDTDPPLVAKAIGTGVTILTQSGATLGQATIQLDPGDTSAIDPGLYAYDVVLVLSGKRYYVVPASDFEIVAVVNPV